MNLYFTLLVLKSKCSGSCNNINNPYAKICVPNVIKNLNVKVFNLMSRTNETRQIRWHETCKCVDQMQVFEIINNAGIMININVNVKN